MSWIKPRILMQVHLDGSVFARSAVNRRYVIAVFVEAKSHTHVRIHVTLNSGNVELVPLFITVELWNTANFGTTRALTQCIHVTLGNEFTADSQSTMHCVQRCYHAKNLGDTRLLYTVFQSVVTDSEIQ